MTKSEEFIKNTKNRPAIQGLFYVSYTFERFLKAVAIINLMRLS